jgi:predicted nuclease of predicted toxin-antitoxin system
MPRISLVSESSLCPPEQLSLRFKIDENLTIEVAEMLRSAGHDAMTVVEQQMKGWMDPGVAQVRQAEGRVLISLDTDFVDVRTYPPQEYPGILVLRLKRQDKLGIMKAFARALRIFPLEPIVGRLWIVEEERVRIRGGE